MILGGWRRVTTTMWRCFSTSTLWRCLSTMLRRLASTVWLARVGWLALVLLRVLASALDLAHS